MTSLSAGNDALATAMTAAMRAGVALERSKAVPWVVSAQYTCPVRGTHQFIKIVEAAKRPDLWDHIPTEATTMAADTFPAIHFADMAPHIRPRYRAQYEVFVKWRRVKEAFNDPADPVAIDYAVELWLRPGSNPLGD